jgi:hypothetical protein
MSVFAPLQIEHPEMSQLFGIGSYLPRTLYAIEACISGFDLPNTVLID